MGSMFSISKFVYADDPAQPSRPGSTSDATIHITNQKHLFFEKGDGPKPPLKMTIREPHSFGLKGSGDVALNKFVDRVLTACNLLLKETRLSTDAADTAPVDISQDRPQDGVRVENKPGRVNVAVTETIVVRARAEVELRSVEELDEAHVREVLDMTHAVYAAPNTSAKVANLIASLESYSHGIVSHHREEVLKGLYVALEKAVNFDKDITSHDFDLKARTLVGNHTLQINRIRKAYDRLKHHTSVKQLPDYPDHEAVFWLVKELRPAVAKAILLRLKEVAGCP